MSKSQTTLFAIRRENGNFFVGFKPSQQSITTMVPNFVSNSLMLITNKDLKETVADIKKFYPDIEIVTIDITTIPKVPV